MAEVGRELWSSSVSTPLLNQDYTELLARMMSRWLMKISKNLQTLWAIDA